MDVSRIQGYNAASAWTETLSRGTAAIEPFNSRGMGARSRVPRPQVLLSRFSVSKRTETTHPSHLSLTAFVLFSPPPPPASPALVLHLPSRALDPNTPPPHLPIPVPLAAGAPSTATLAAATRRIESHVHVLISTPPLSSRRGGKRASLAPLPPLSGIPPDQRLAGTVAGVSSSGGDLQAKGYGGALDLIQPNGLVPSGEREEREKEGEEGEREERGEGAAAADGRASPTIASPPSLLVNAAVSISATSSSHAAASFRTPLRRARQQREVLSGSTNIIQLACFSWKRSEDVKTCCFSFS
ncbi:uncharacterized protein LOC125533114 [Triticum urartu]|uniref:uncharacterized protein LOC125533114 n=1 Tax=Triticum urartu TaxID=4572 RepID=UPI002043BEDF|nr:uncharacterized protein LOC125533114 [Triticum urartu]